MGGFAARLRQALLGRAPGWRLGERRGLRLADGPGDAGMDTPDLSFPPRFSQVPCRGPDQGRGRLLAFVPDRQYPRRESPRRALDLDGNGLRPEEGRDARS